MQHDILQLRDRVEDIVARLNIVTEEELLEFSILREDIINKLLITNDLSSDDITNLKHLSKYDQLIIGRMEQLRDEAAEGLKKISISRNQRKKYTDVGAPHSYFVNKLK